MDEKTNVMRILDQKKIKYNKYCYADTDKTASHGPVPPVPESGTSWQSRPVPSTDRSWQNPGKDMPNKTPC